MSSSLTRSSASACLQVQRVHKRFGATFALQDVSLTVLEGEVHALLGHNGSGKSTLVKMVSGSLSPDSGSLSVTGREGTPARVGVVHQDLALCAEATVVENCCMGGYHRGRFGTLDWATERRLLQPILDSLNAEFDCRDMVGDLSPADQAVVAIARALRGQPGSSGLDLLVLDEATALLRGREADKVLTTARLVADQGGGVLLVTHHMAEVLHAADRATVLSNGQVVGTVDVESTSEDRLLEMVSGRKLPAQRHEPAGDAAGLGESAVLTVRGLGGSSVSGVHLAVGAGEIVGLTGAAGAGHEEVPYLLAGHLRVQRGHISVAGRELRGRGAAGARGLGIGLLPADRLRQGLLPAATVRENLSPQVRRHHTWLRFSQLRRERAWAAQVCADYEVRPPDPDALVSSLSGGNQQKVLLARVLADQPRVLVLHEPTQGVDEATRRALLRRIRRVAEEGAAVVYVSSDLEEVAACCDRVLIFRKGQVATEVDGGLAHIDDIYAHSYLTDLLDPSPRASAPASEGTQ